MAFDYSQDFKKIDFKKNPELYQTGKGEQGVLSVEPYKSEILPHWRFKTPEVAKVSSEKIYKMFLEYLENEDFVGADIARKFLQMGFTRSRRYANHSSGTKYSTQDDPAKKLTESEMKNILINSKFKTLKNKLHSVKTKTKVILPKKEDLEKAESAKIFYKKYVEARENVKYLKLKEEHKLKTKT